MSKHKELVAANRTTIMKSNDSSAAAASWNVSLEWYESRTKEGLIVYPPRVMLWRNVYRVACVPYMHLRGVIWRHSDEPREATQDKRSVVCGSIGIWHSGQRRALELIGEEKLGEGKRFRFVSRKQHSA